MAADLDVLLADLGRALGRGAHDPRAPFRHLALATLAERGPAVRTVVLRGADLAAGWVEVHSDRRAAKVVEIGARSAVALAFWDARHRQQLRAEGRARAVDEPDARGAAWARLGAAGRAIYAGRLAPGSPREGPGASAPDAADLSSQDTARARAQLVILRVDLVRLDWLSLGREGQRRAAFRRGADGWRGEWREP